MKRRGMTLIEIVISLGLVSLLLTTLLFWYSQLSQKKMSHAKEYRPVLQQYFAFKRLTNIFDTVTLASPKGKTCFFSSQESDNSQSLVFTFNRGLHPAPELSDTVLAKLYVKNNALVMSLWPQPKDLSQSVSMLPYETIVLLEGISSIKYQFLAPQKSQRLAVDPKSVGDSIISPGWHDQWHPHYKQLPALISCTLEGRTPHHWIFDLHLPLQYSVLSSNPQVLEVG